MKFRTKYKKMKCERPNEVIIKIPDEVKIKLPRVIRVRDLRKSFTSKK